MDKNSNSTDSPFGSSGLDFNQIPEIESDLYWERKNKGNPYSRVNYVNNNLDENYKYEMPDLKEIKKQLDSEPPKQNISSEEVFMKLEEKIAKNEYDAIIRLAGCAVRDRKTLLDEIEESMGEIRSYSSKIDKKMIVLREQIERLKKLTVLG